MLLCVWIWLVLRHDVHNPFAFSALMIFCMYPDVLGSSFIHGNSWVSSVDLLQVLLGHCVAVVRSNGYLMT